MSDKKWYNSQWMIGVGTTVIGIVLTIVVDLVREKKVLSTVLEILGSLWQMITKAMTFNIELWIVLLVFLGIFLIKKCWSWITRNAKESEPNWMSYTRDADIKGWAWSWRWGKNGFGEWKCNNLKAHCPACDTPLKVSDAIYAYTFTCPRCSYRKTGVSNQIITDALQFQYVCIQPFRKYLT